MVLRCLCCSWCYIHSFKNALRYLCTDFIALHTHTFPRLTNCLSNKVVSLLSLRWNCSQVFTCVGKATLRHLMWGEGCLLWILQMLSASFVFIFNIYVTWNLKIQKRIVANSLNGFHVWCLFCVFHWTRKESFLGNATHKLPTYQLVYSYFYIWYFVITLGWRRSIVYFYFKMLSKRWNRCWNLQWFQCKIRIETFSNIWIIIYLVR